MHTEDVNPLAIVLLVGLLAGAFAVGMWVQKSFGAPRAVSIRMDGTEMRRVGELRNNCILYQLSIPGKDEPTSRMLAIWCPTQRLPFELEHIKP